MFSFLGRTSNSGGGNAFIAAPDVGTSSFNRFLTNLRRKFNLNGRTESQQSNNDIELHEGSANVSTSPIPSPTAAETNFSIDAFFEEDSRLFEAESSVGNRFEEESSVGATKPGHCKHLKLVLLPDEDLVQHLQSEIRARDFELAEKEELIDNRDQVIVHKNRVLQEKEWALQDRTMKIESQKRTLLEMQQKLKFKDDVIRTKELEVRSLDGRLQAQMLKSWRLDVAVKVKEEQIRALSEQLGEGQMDKSAANPAENDSVKKKFECGVCFQPVTAPHILLPCAHFPFCSGCLDRVEWCPHCRAEIEDRQRVFCTL